MHPTTTDVQPTQLLRQLASGRWRSEVLRVFVALGLPEELSSTPRSVPELAVQLHSDSDALGRYLCLAASLGLVSFAGAGLFSANAVTDALRSGGMPSARLDCEHMLAEWQNLAWTGLEFAVRSGRSGFEKATGGGVFDYLSRHPEEASIFHQFQGRITRQTATSLLASDLLPDASSVVDVGGGFGTMALTLLAGRPDLRCASFDCAGVASRRDASMPGCEAAEDRVTWVEGDFLVDDCSLPAGADVYLLSQVLHDWADSDAASILRNVARAMGQDSRLLVIESLMQPSSGPLVRYLDVLMLTAWGSRERDLAGYELLLQKAGLKVTATTTLDSVRDLTAIMARPV